jgi:hypothetical protein
MQGQYFYSEVGKLLARQNVSDVLYRCNYIIVNEIKGFTKEGKINSSPIYDI